MVNTVNEDGRKNGYLEQIDRIGRFQQCIETITKFIQEAHPPSDWDAVRQQLNTDSTTGILLSEEPCIITIKDPASVQGLMEWVSKQQGLIQPDATKLYAHELAHYETCDRYGFDPIYQVILSEDEETKKIKVGWGVLPQNRDNLKEKAFADEGDPYDKLERILRFCLMNAEAYSAPDDPSSNDFQFLRDLREIVQEFERFCEPKFGSRQALLWQAIKIKTNPEASIDDWGVAEAALELYGKTRRIKVVGRDSENNEVVLASPNVKFTNPSELIHILQQPHTDKRIHEIAWIIAAQTVNFIGKQYIVEESDVRVFKYFVACLETVSGLMSGSRCSEFQMSWGYNHPSSWSNAIRPIEAIRKPFTRDEFEDYLRYMDSKDVGFGGNRPNELTFLTMLANSSFDNPIYGDGATSKAWKSLLEYNTRHKAFKEEAKLRYPSYHEDESGFDVLLGSLMGNGETADRSAVRAYLAHWQQITKKPSEEELERVRKKYPNIPVNMDISGFSSDDWIGFWRALGELCAKYEHPIEESHDYIPQFPPIGYQEAETMHETLSPRLKRPSGNSLEVASSLQDELRRLQRRTVEIRVELASLAKAKNLESSDMVGPPDISTPAESPQVEFGNIRPSPKREFPEKGWLDTLNEDERQMVISHTLTRNLRDQTFSRARDTIQALIRSLGGNVDTANYSVPGAGGEVQRQKDRELLQILRRLLEEAEL